MQNKTEIVGAVIVAAGEGKRMGVQDKIFAPLGGRPALARLVGTFEASPEIDKIVLVVSGPGLDKARQLRTAEGWRKVAAICPGGKRRQDSVSAGLGQLDACDWVIVHDGARPLVTPGLIAGGLAAARETGAAVAAVPVTDTIKVAGEDMLVQGTPPRGMLWAVQTPQVFRYDIIMQAYRGLKFDVTDDASLVERMGHKVKLYMGSYDNIKITTPRDLILAEALLTHGKL